MESDWLAWPELFLESGYPGTSASETSSLTNSGTSSLENGPACPELRTLHHLSSPVPPQLLSAQLHTLSQASLSSTATAQVDVPDFISHAIPTYPAPSNTLDPSSLPSVVPHLQVLDSSTAPATSSLLEELPQPVPPEAPAPGSSESPASTVSNGTSVYKDRRARNTEASKRFRANKKAREREVAEQLQELKSDNERLRKRVNSLEKENKLLRSFLTGKTRARGD